jgi:predicted HicB family RNase H-like nuclease
MMRFLEKRMKAKKAKRDPKIILSARVPADLHKALWRKADRRGITLSEVINEMLADAIRRDEHGYV